MAITGWAWRTPLGSAIEPVMAKLDAGARAAAVNPHFEASSYACGLCAAIPGQPARSRHARVLRRPGLYGFESAAEALAQSGRAGGPRLGLFAAIGGLRAHWDDMMPALAAQVPEMADSWQRGLRLLHPFWMLKHLSNNTHALLAQALGARGEGVTFGGANAGAQALSAARRALADGAIDAALVVAHDSLIEPETIVEMAARGVLATTSSADPAGSTDPAGSADASDLAAAVPPPYAAGARGQVPAECAAALVLERRVDAGARALGLVHAVDGADRGPSLPQPPTVERVLARLLAEVAHAPHAARDRQPEPEWLVDGAARALADADGDERALLAALLPEATPLTAVQAAMGLLGAPAILIQIIALAQALERGRVYPIAGLGAGSAHTLAPGPLAPVTAASATTARAAIALATGAPGLVGAAYVTAAPGRH